MKNNLSDLNNHLFAMLEELGDGTSAYRTRYATSCGSTTREGPPRR